MKVAFLGFGEVAHALLEGWREAGVCPRISAYDVKTDDPACAGAKRCEYEAAGVDGAANATGAVRGADIIVSAVTADQASRAATSVAEFAGAWFLDLNSCAPETKRANAKAVNAAGGRYLDVAVMGPIRPARHKVPLLVAGPADGQQVLALLSMDARQVAGEVGAASAVKMIRSVMVKGMEAVFAECVLAARAAGVEDAVFQSLSSSYPETDFAARAAYNLERMTTHGLRRAAEMEEVGRTVAGLGLPSEMSAATVSWQRRLGALGLAGEGDHKTRADEILKLLR